MSKIRDESSRFDESNFPSCSDKGSHDGASGPGVMADGIVKYTFFTVCRIDLT